MKMGTEFWEAHVAAAKLEAIPASEYARRHGLSVTALYYWQHKLKSCRGGEAGQESNYAMLLCSAQTSAPWCCHPTCIWKCLRCPRRNG